MGNDNNLAALEYLTNSSLGNVHENHMPTVKHRIANFLLAIPEPAAQTAALQLMKSKLAFDKSLGLCIGLVGLAILEEMV